MTAGRPGIRRFGAYLPRLRLERKAIAAATAFATGSRAGAAKGTRSCCNWDEDSLTMAVEAARDCLAGIEAPAIDSLTFASTSHAFADRSNAGVVATALNLDESLRVADAGGHQRAGVGALLAALSQADDEFDAGRRGRPPPGQASQRTGIVVRSWRRRTAGGHGRRTSQPSCWRAPRCRTISSITTAAATRASITRSKSAGCATRAT